MKCPLCDLELVHAGDIRNAPHVTYTLYYHILQPRQGVVWHKRVTFKDAVRSNKIFWTYCAAADEWTIGRRQFDYYSHYERVARRQLLQGHYRPIILKRDGYKCRVCGSTKRLEMHHITPVSEYHHTPLEAIFVEHNLITLCWECHKKVRSRYYHGFYRRYELISLHPNDANEKAILVVKSTNRNRTRKGYSYSINYTEPGIISD